MRSILISSPTNPTIKDLVRLKDRKSERAASAFVVEGQREIERAIASGFTLEDLFFCRQELNTNSTTLLENARPKRMAEVSKDAFAKVAMREGADGLIAVFAIKNYTLDDILKKAAGRSPFILAVENVEKPGNLGAILRTADGAGVDGVVVLDGAVDIWNPNLIRASLGGAFSLPVVQSDTSSFFEWCDVQHIKTFAAALSERSRSIFDVILKRPLAIVMGSEAHGLSEIALSKAHDLILIPMHGVCDSLNVSVAAGILAYEAVRQNKV